MRVCPTPQTPTSLSLSNSSMSSNSSLDLGKYVNQKIHVHFQGGRQLTGTLKGFDQLVNLVLEDAEETLVGNSNVGGNSKSSGVRKVGTVMCKGTAVTLVTPLDGYGEIANPFVNSEE